MSLKRSAVPGGLILDIKVGEWVEFVFGERSCKLHFVDGNSRRVKVQMISSCKEIKFHRSSFTERRAGRPAGAVPGA